MSLPPPVPLGDTVAVGIDIGRTEATLTFDVAGRLASGQASVEFTVGPDSGCPAFDLRQPVDWLRLDGATLPPDAAAARDLGTGGPGAMRVLDRPLDAGTRHRLEVGYRLDQPDTEGAQPVEWRDSGARFDLWMSDLHPGRYLEMWVPANLCHDRFALTLHVRVLGAPTEHTVVTNGAETALAPGHWRIDYPAHFTSLSPMLVLAAAAELETAHGRVPMAGRARHLEVLTARHLEVDADVAACHADIVGWLAANAARFGPWVHGSRFTEAFDWKILLHAVAVSAALVAGGMVWGPGRGMEYDGATTASVAALEHEVFHSWFGRGVKPARAADGWIDEAWTSWATSTRRSEGEARFAAVEQGLDEAPVVLYPPHPWSRFTPVESYREGARLCAGLAWRLGGAGRLRSAMAAWYRAHAGGLVTTDGLETHLSQWSGLDVGPWFDRYVHGGVPRGARGGDR